MSELQHLQPGQTTAVLRSRAGSTFSSWSRSAAAARRRDKQTTRAYPGQDQRDRAGVEARKRIMEINSSSKMGRFCEQAKRYSQDGSAQQGGDLDWVSPAKP